MLSTMAATPRSRPAPPPARVAAQELREYAEQSAAAGEGAPAVPEAEAAEQGMREMSLRFREQGAEIYH